MAKTGTCRECGKDNVSIIAKGLCWKCRAAAIAAGTYDGQKIPEQSRERDFSGIDALLGTSGHMLEIPGALLQRMEAAGVWPADVIILIEMLLDGRLRRVA